MLCLACFEQEGKGNQALQATRRIIGTALALQLQSKILIQASATFNLHTATNGTTPRQADSCAGCRSLGCLHVAHGCCRGKAAPIRQRPPMSRAIVSSAVGEVQEADGLRKLLRVTVSHVRRVDTARLTSSSMQDVVARDELDVANFLWQALSPTQLRRLERANLPRSCAWPLEQQSPRALLKPRVVWHSEVVAHRCPRSA